MWGDINYFEPLLKEKARYEEEYWKESQEKINRGERPEVYGSGKWNLPRKLV